MARHGADVVVSARSADEVASVVQHLHEEGLSVSGCPCDVRVAAEVASLRDHAQRRGKLDIWVNNAGVAGVYGPTASTPPEDFARVVETNILGTFHGARAALPVFLRQGSGDLVDVYGQGDTGPVALENAYACSKRWVRQFTETLQKETRGTGARVHGINPGLMTTAFLGHVAAQPGLERRLRALPIVAALWGRSPEEAAEPMLELVTYGRRRYTGLTAPKLVLRGMRSIVAGRLRRDKRMSLEITVVDGTSGPLR